MCPTWTEVHISAANGGPQAEEFSLWISHEIRGDLQLREITFLQKRAKPICRLFDNRMGENAPKSTPVNMPIHKAQQPVCSALRPRQTVVILSVNLAVTVKLSHVGWEVVGCVPRGPFWLHRFMAGPLQSHSSWTGLTCSDMKT